MSNNILSQMASFCGRLREERVRLGLNQTDFAALGGVQKDAQFKYETDKRMPDAGYFGALFQAGVDIQYVITGVASSNTVGPDEVELVEGYRGLDIRGKSRVLGMIQGMAVPKAVTDKVVFNGTVSQVVHGDQTVTAPMNFSIGNKRPKK